MFTTGGPIILGTPGEGVNGGGGNIGGTISAGQIAVGGAVADTITGSSALTFVAGFLELASTAGMDITDTSADGITISVSGSGTGAVTIKADASSTGGLVFENDGTTAGITINNNGGSAGTLIEDSGGGGFEIHQSAAAGFLNIVDDSTGSGIFLHTTASSGAGNGITFADGGSGGIIGDTSAGTGALAFHTNATGGLTIQHAGGAVQTGQNATESATVTSITITDGFVTAITGTSDERLKTNINPFTRGLTSILDINPCTYQWNELGQQKTNFPAHLVQAGFIAQNVQTAIPEAVGQEDGYLSLDTRPIIAALVNAIKELHQKITVLEQKLGA